MRPETAPHQLFIKDGVKHLAQLPESHESLLALWDSEAFAQRWYDFENVRHNIFNFDIPYPSAFHEHVVQLREAMPYLAQIEPVPLRDLVRHEHRDGVGLRRTTARQTVPETWNRVTEHLRRHHWNFMQPPLDWKLPNGEVFKPEARASFLLYFWYGEYLAQSWCKPVAETFRLAFEEAAFTQLGGHDYLEDILPMMFRHIDKFPVSLKSQLVALKKLRSNLGTQRGDRS